MAGPQISDIPTSEGGAPVGSDAYVAALAELVKHMLGVKQSLAAPQSGAADKLPVIWGAGDRRSPHYKAQAVELPPPPGWGGDAKALQVDIGRPPKVGAGEYGLPDIGRMPDQQGKDEALRIVQKARGDERMRGAGFDPEATFESTLGNFAKHDVPAAALGLVPGGRVAGKAIAAAVPAAAALIPNSVSPSELPQDKGSDDALNNLRMRQDAIRQQMDKQSEIMSAQPPKPRKQGQPDADERSDPKFFNAKKAYDIAKQQFDALGGQISEEQTQRRERARLKQEGEARVAGAMKNRSTTDTVLEDYGPYAGYVLGAALGAWKGKSVADKFTTKAQTLANEANTTLQPGANWNRRAGGVNDYFDRGGAREIPFPSAPGQTPPFRINPDAPEAAQLYRQSPGRETVAHMPWLALAGVDAGVGGWLEHHYGKEVLDAEKAMQDDGSSANIARWEGAKRKEGFFGTIGNIGRTSAPFQMGVGSIPGLVGNRARPQSGLADSERAAVDDWIRRARGASGSVGPSGPGPIPLQPTPQQPLALPAPVQSISPAAPAPQAPTAAPTVPAVLQPAAPPKRQSRPAAQSSQSSPSGVDLPEGHVLTEWGVRGQKGQWASKPDALKQSTAKTKADNPEHSVNSPTPEAPFVKEPQAPWSDLEPYGRPRPNGRQSRLLDLYNSVG